MVNYVKHGLIVMRSGSSAPVFLKMEAEATQAGYTFSSLRFHENRDKIEILDKICRSRDVKGIYILASEMEQGDICPFLKLNVPRSRLLD